VLVHEKGWKGKLAGVLPTFYDEQTRTTREQMVNLQSAFPDQRQITHPRLYIAVDSSQSFLLLLDTCLLAFSAR
jgi:hypothetical protein